MDGYEEAEKIDSLITDLVLYDDQSTLEELREMVKLVRTVKTSCELVERNIIDRMSSLFNDLTA